MRGLRALPLAPRLPMAGAAVSQWLGLQTPRKEDASSREDARLPVRIGPVMFRSTCSRHNNGSAAASGGGTGGSGSGRSSCQSPPRCAPAKGSMAEDVANMYEERALTDIEIVCPASSVDALSDSDSAATRGASLSQSQWTFHAHRMVLAARSSVFRAMFSVGMLESHCGRVVLEDVSPDAVKCLLHYAYRDECPDLDEGSLFDVLQISNKYDMPGLRDICLEFMAHHCHSHNVVAYLTAVERYNLTNFKHALLNALVDSPPALHECVQGRTLDSHPNLMKQLLALCSHRLSRNNKAPPPPHSQDRHPLKRFDGLPYWSQCPLCVQEVASMSKQMLGEMLFPMVQSIRPEHANKITGMIIELDNLELVPLFESEHALREKVAEAVLVLRTAERPEVQLQQQPESEEQQDADFFGSGDQQQSPSTPRTPPPPPPYVDQGAEGPLEGAMTDHLEYPCRWGGGRDARNASAW